MSWRPLRIQAGASVIASRTCCTPDERSPASRDVARAAVRTRGRGRRGGRVRPRRVAARRRGRRARSRRRRPGAPFHPDVVVHRDPGQQGDLFAPQALDPAVAAVTGRPACSGVRRARRELRNSWISCAGRWPCLHSRRAAAREALALPGTTVTPAPRPTFTGSHASDLHVRRRRRPRR